MEQPAEQPTTRQLHMIALSAQGRSREEIGRELIVSPWTVKMDLDLLRKQLEARNVTHAVTICLVLGLLVIVDDTVIVAEEQRQLAAA